MAEPLDPRLEGIQPMRLPKMAELIANQLRRQIVQGELREGDTLPSESELISRFQVSRPTLREAFRVLESESLITVRRGVRGGAKVHVPDVDVAARYAGFILQFRQTPLDDLYQARILIEPPVVAELAEQRTEDDVTRLRVALAEHDEAAGDPKLSISTHTAFHALLIELAGNQTLQVLTGMVADIIARANWQQVEATLGTPTHAKASSKGLKAHHRVVDLIDQQRAADARTLWKRHLVEAREYLLLNDARTVLDLMN